jgi:hypothetical protein
MRLDHPPINLKKAALRAIREGISKGFVYETIYQYSAVDGEPVFWKIRARHPQTGAKWIRLMTPRANGFVAKGPICVDGTPLYRLPNLCKADSSTVFVVEGEPAAEALTRLGLCTTTSGAANPPARQIGAFWLGAISLSGPITTMQEPATRKALVKSCSVLAVLYA